MRIASRFIAEEPSVSISSQEVYRLLPVFTWRFESVENLAPWTSLDGELERRDGQLVAPAAEFPRIVRSVDLRSEDVDRIEVAVSGFREGRLQLFWSGPDQDFHRDRRLILNPILGAAPPSEQLYEFDATSHPLWKGRIARLRFDIRSSSSQEVHLRVIRGLEKELDAGRLRGMVDRAWKVDLEHDVRHVLLAPPGHEIARELVLAAGSRLHFAYGTEARIERAVEFRVSAEVDGASRRVLFAARIDPGDADRTGSWHEASVDLSELAGRRVRLFLETSSAGGRAWTKGLPYWANPVVLEPVSKPPPDVVLIVIDTLRADRLSLYGYPRQTTPELDSWAQRRGVTFRTAVAPAPWTLPSHISIFTGLDALNHGHNHDRPLAGSMVTLAEMLRHRGYRTAAITGGVYLHPQYGLTQGFDTFRYWPSEGSQAEELADGVERALAWLESNPVRPSFLFFHTYEVHAPFHARQPFFDRLTGGAAIGDLEARLAGLQEPAGEEEGFQVRRRYALKPQEAGDDKTILAGSEIPRVGDLYDSGIAYADSQVGRLLERLGDDAIVVLTSDHGEALGERGLASHAYLYDFNLLVPLIVSLPGGAGAGRTVDHQVRLVDILPTIMDAAGLDVPGHLDGVSLRPWIDRPGASADPLREAWAYASSTNYGVSLRLSNRLKYVYTNTPWTATHGDEELYRLSEDPDEMENIADGQEAVDTLRERVFEKVQQGFKGLRADIANLGSLPYELALDGSSWVLPGKVKALDLRGAVVEYRKPKRLAISVPAGGELSLYFEGIDPRDPLRIAGAGESVCRVDFGDLPAGVPRRLELDHRGCRIDGNLSPGTVTLTLSLTGPTGAPDTSDIDPGLEEKLRALGYLN